MASNPQILSDLRVIQEADHQIELLTTYKGVPFVCRAIIERIQEGRVLVKALDPYMVCLEADKKPRVLGSDYFEPSVASVTYIDIQSGEIELDDFTYVGTKLGERMIVRVEPKKTIAVKLHTEVQETIGNLADISINGIGVHVAISAYNPTLKPGTIVQTQFMLPTGDIAMSGTVLSASKMDVSYRISIRFNNHSTQKILIFKYLIDRRVEIENELVTNYQAFMNIP
jgi:hypothetical protein